MTLPSANLPPEADPAAKRMLGLLESGEYADCIVSCGDTQWKCHRAILGSGSAWFREQIAKPLPVDIQYSLGSSPLKRRKIEVAGPPDDGDSRDYRMQDTTSVAEGASMDENNEMQIEASSGEGMNADRGCLPHASNDASNTTPDDKEHNTRTHSNESSAQSDEEKSSDQDLALALALPTIPLPSGTYSPSAVSILLTHIYTLTPSAVENAIQASLSPPRPPPDRDPDSDSVSNPTPALTRRITTLLFLLRLTDQMQLQLQLQYRHCRLGCGSDAGSTPNPDPHLEPLSDRVQALLVHALADYIRADLYGEGVDDGFLGRCLREIYQGEHAHADKVEDEGLQEGLKGRPHPGPPGGHWVFRSDFEDFLVREGLGVMGRERLRGIVQGVRGFNGVVVFWEGDDGGSEEGEVSGSGKRGERGSGSASDFREDGGKWSGSGSGSGAGNGSEDSGIGLN